MVFVYTNHCVTETSEGSVEIELHYALDCRSLSGKNLRIKINNNAICNKNKIYKPMF